MGICLFFRPPWPARRQRAGSFEHTSALWTTHLHPHGMNDIAIDPPDPNHVMIATGYGIRYSKDEPGGQ
jgi:hypothetical protein